MSNNSERNSTHLFNTSLSARHDQTFQWNQLVPKSIFQDISIACLPSGQFQSFISKLDGILTMLNEDSSHNLSSTLLENGENNNGGEERQSATVIEGDSLQRIRFTKTTWLGSC